MLLPQGAPSWVLIARMKAFDRHNHAGCSAFSNVQAFLSFSGPRTFFITLKMIEGKISSSFMKVFTQLLTAPWSLGGGTGLS